jgi:hypothetical protein
LHGFSGVGNVPAAQSLIEFGSIAAPGRLPVLAVPEGRHGFCAVGSSPAAHAGNWPRSTFVPWPGLHGLSGVGCWPAAQGENFEMSICPFAWVGWHGFCGVGSWPAWQGGNWLRSSFVPCAGAHGLSCVGCWPVAHGGNFEMSIWPVTFVAWHGFVGWGCSPGAHGGNFDRSIAVLAPGRHGLSGVGFWSVWQTGNFEMSIWPFALVGRHGFVG